MPLPLPVRVAWQGHVHRLPADWEVAASSGDWRTGHLLLACGRRAVMRISWRRDRLRSEIETTLRHALQRTARETGFAPQAGRETIGPDGALARCSGRDGEIAVGARRFPLAGTTLVWRQLVTGNARELAAIADAADAVADDQPAPWDIHGLACTLPAWWRCEGITAVAGLSRAVWFHQPPGRRRPDAALVLRRLACAGRVLAGRTPEEWLRTSLRRREQAVSEPLRDGTVHLVCTRPAANWWRRWRGRTDIRHLHAWIDADADRLTVQEWAGAGEPLPCLRSPGIPHRVGHPDREPHSP